MRQLICLSFFLLIANIASAQLVNADFENWFVDSNGHNKLYNWQYLDMNGNVSHSFYLATWKSGNPEHGSYALQLSRWYSYRSEWVMQKVAISSRPGSLDGYYEYVRNELLSPYVLDTASVEIWLTAWNSSVMRNDTIGKGRCVMTASADYSAFSCPLSYTGSGTPGSIVVLIKPTVWNLNTVFCRDSSCSFLLIDNLSLSAPSEIIQNPMSDLFIYPNPVINEMYIRNGTQNKAVMLRVENMLGQTMCNIDLHDTETAINVSAWPPGIYYVRSRDQSGMRTIRKIVRE